MDLYKNTYVSAIDGCVAVNDPTLCAMVQADSLYPRADAFLLLSMGTGQCISEVSPKGLLTWAKHISTILMSNSSEMSSHTFKKFGLYSNSALFFSRLQFDISEAHAAMDNISPENLSYLEHQAQTTISAMNKIRNLGKILRISDKPKKEDLSVDNSHKINTFTEI